MFLNFKVTLFVNVYIPTYVKKNIFVHMVSLSAQRISIEYILPDENDYTNCKIFVSMMQQN